MPVLRGGVRFAKTPYYVLHRPRNAAKTASTTTTFASCSIATSLNRALQCLTAHLASLLHRPLAHRTQKRRCCCRRQTARSNAEPAPSISRSPLSAWAENRHDDKPYPTLSIAGCRHANLSATNDSGEQGQLVGISRNPSLPRRGCGNNECWSHKPWCHTRNCQIKSRGPTPQRGG